MRGRVPIEGMPRPPRTELPGGIHHVTARGVVRQADLPRRPRSPDVSRAARERHDADVLALPQLLPDGQPRAPADRDAAANLEPRHAAAARRVRPDVQPPAQADRATSSRAASDAEAVVEATRNSGSPSPYIVNNPVAAGLCATPEEWPWSSHGAVGEPAALARRSAALLVLRRDGRRPRARYLDLRRGVEPFRRPDPRQAAGRCCRPSRRGGEARRRARCRRGEVVLDADGDVGVDAALDQAVLPRGGAGWRRACGARCRRSCAAAR